MYCAYVLFLSYDFGDISNAKCSVRRKDRLPLYPPPPQVDLRLINCKFGADIDMI